MARTILFEGIVDFLTVLVDDEEDVDFFDTVDDEEFDDVDFVLGADEIFLPKT